MKTKKKKGFTLTELIVVIVIIGVLATVMIPTLSGYITKAQNSKDETLVASLNKSYQNAKIMDDIEIYSAYDVEAFLKKVEMENIEVANKNNLILFDAVDNKFVLVKDVESETTTNEFVYHISEYYSYKKVITQPVNNKKGNAVLKPLASQKLEVGEGSTYEQHRAFIISINGPEEAIAVAAFMKINGDITQSELDEFKDIFTKSYKDSKFKENLSSALSKTLFIGKNKSIYINSSYVIKEFDGTNPTDQSLTRVSISEDVSELNLDSVQNLEQCTIIVPTTVESINLMVTLSSSIEVSGNVSDDVNCTKISLEESLIKPMIKELINVSTKVYNEQQLKDILACYKKLETQEIKDLLEQYSVSINVDKTIFVCDNFEITENTIIPKGVTLRVPYNSSNALKENGSDQRISKIYISDTEEDKTYLFRNLTINENVVLKVEGVLEVGAMVNAYGQPLACHTSGAYGQVTNNGSIEICGDATEGNGKLDVYGYIIGSGKIVSKSATIVQQFTIGDYGGGTNTGILILNNRTPFGQYNLANIWCEVELDSDSTYQGRGAVWASDAWQEIQSVNIIGKAGTSSLIRMNAGAKATVTYNPKEQLSQSRASLTSLGKLKISIIGGAETGSFTISLAGYDADTSKFVLPVPYGFAFEFNSASSEKVDEYKISSGIALLPGSELKVGNNTKLTINSSGSLSVFDSLSELTFSLKSNNSPKYPTTGYAANPAKLVLEGTLNVEGGFGGSIEGYDGAKLILGKNAKGAYTGTYKCVDSDTHKQLICGKEIQINPFKDNYHLSHTSSCYEYACKKIPIDYQECYSTALKVEFGFVKEGLVGSISGLAWNNEENGVTYNTYCKIKTSANGNNIIAHSNTTYTYNSQGYWE